MIRLIGELKPIVGTGNSSTAYQLAVEQVRNATAGTLISRAESQTVNVTFPNPFEVIPKLMLYPIFYGIGTREQKSVFGAGILPLQVKTTTAYDIAKGGGTVTTKGMGDITQEVINAQKTSDPALKSWWETGVVGTTNITLPEFQWPKLPDLGSIFGNLGKYAIVIIAVIVLIILFMKGEK